MTEPPKTDLLTLDEAYDLAITETGPALFRDSFLSDIRAHLVTGKLTAYCPNRGELRIIPKDAWRDVKPVYNRGGFAVPESMDEQALAWTFGLSKPHPGHATVCIYYPMPVWPGLLNFAPLRMLLLRNEIVEMWGAKKRRSGPRRERWEEIIKKIFPSGIPDHAIMDDAAFCQHVLRHSIAKPLAALVGDHRRSIKRARASLSSG